MISRLADPSGIDQTRVNTGLWEQSNWLRGVSSTLHLERLQYKPQRWSQTTSSPGTGIRPGRSMPGAPAGHSYGQITVQQGSHPKRKPRLQGEMEGTAQMGAVRAIQRKGLLQMRQVQTPDRLAHFCFHSGWLGLPLLFLHKNHLRLTQLG